jgi:hypothetical protein
MAMFKEDSDKYVQQASDDIYGGLNSATQSLSPWTQNAGTDFGNARGALYSATNQRMQGPNYNDNFFNLLNYSPEDIVSHILGGYSESPMAQMNSNIAMSGMDNHLAMNGMYDSGDNRAADAQIENYISQEDMGNYLHMIDKTFNTQEGIAKWYDQGTSQLIKLWQSMLGREFGATRDLSQDQMRAGEEAARAEERGAMDNRNAPSPMDQMMSMLGPAMGMQSGRGGRGGSGGGGNHKAAKTAGTVALIAM